MGILAGCGALSLMCVKGFGKIEAPPASTEPTEVKPKPAPAIPVTEQPSAPNGVGHEIEMTVGNA